MYVVVAQGEEYPLVVFGPFEDRIQALIFAGKREEDEVDVCEVLPPDYPQNN